MGGVEPRPGVSLLVYADRLGGTISQLTELLNGPLAAFKGVHLLPFFTPFDGTDAGFDPIDHTIVDPRLGDWGAVAQMAKGRDVTADIIVNHVSAESLEFVDWLEQGDESPHDGMFLTFDTVFSNGGTEAEIVAFYRPRPGLPFTAYRGSTADRHLVWTTFMPTQVDLDVRHPAALDYLDRIIATLVAAGVAVVRLDAVGYAIKTPGTDSFMTAETLEFVGELTDRIRSAGMRVLVEVHAHFEQQLAIAPLVDLVYDFALAPLVLDAWVGSRVERLAHWLDIRPTNAVTVLDTHDGIGIIDAGPIGDRKGLISFDDMVAIFERAEEMTGGHSAIASVVPQWFDLPHQINATYLNVLGGDADRYLAARALQLFLPGEPQIYYVGLLGGMDDRALFERTGNGRDVNRHVYDRTEVDAALDSDITRAILALVRIRSEHPAFGGTFRHRVSSSRVLTAVWECGGDVAMLDFAADGDLRFTLMLSGPAGTRSASSAAELISLF